MRRTIGIAFQRDRRHANNREFGQSRFELVVLSLAISRADTPTVVVDGDVDVIGILKGGGAAVEGRVVEIPFR
jgi:hypothetical protein